jgi:dihydroorotate dehydrogenase
MGASAAVTNGAQFIEFNLACPNVTENNAEGEMFQDPKLVAYTLAEFKRRFPNIPVGFKFGLYKSRDQMKKVFVACGDNLDYVSGVNAIATPVRGEDGKDILPGRSVSGVCGAVMKDLALEEIHWAAEIRKETGLKYEILGGGGVITPKDAKEFLSAGADAVQVATIALTNPLFAFEYSKKS